MIKKTTVILLLCAGITACSPDNTEVITPVPFQCINSHSHCEIVTAFGTVLIKFNVKKVVTEYPFTVLVELKNNTIRAANAKSKKVLNVSGYMEGKTMFMGKIPLFFNRKNEGQENNAYLAETMLGSCAKAQMTWRLWLTLEKKQEGGDKQQIRLFIYVDSTRM